MRRLYTLLLSFPLLAAAPATWVEHTIATDLKGGYHVVAADLNHDGRPDLIALASGMSELVWYENPGWQRHVLAAGQSRMINCAVVGDEIVLASEFSMQAKDSAGVVSVLRRGPGKDPRKNDPREPWTVTEIDRLPTSHRLRTADIDGSGHLVVINAALTGAEASAPDYRGQTPLVYYVPGEWKRRVIGTENSGVVHGIFVTDWDGNGRESILSASFTGIHLFRYTKDGRWTRTLLAEGDPAPWPKSGSSDIAVGQLGKTRFLLGEGRFLAAIEPWHGNQVAVYTQRGAQWEREVIDASLKDGHTIQVADLNGDGVPEIIVGFRGQPRSVYLYSYDTATKRWTRSDLDKGGMGAAACTVVDLNKDGRPDIACIDSTRLKWYENTPAY